MADISNITVSVEGVNTVCEIKDKVARNNIALNRTTLGTQCKNLCNVTYTTRKVHTVNITVNSDKSLGLLTDSTTSIVCIEILTPLIRLYANVTYILTGTNNGDIRIELRDSSKSNILVYDSGSGVEYTPNKDIDVYVCLRIEKSTSITSAITVYPMLRIKGTDDTYEPYKENVDERLIQNKSDIAVNKTTLGYQCKNLHNTLSVNWYQPGKTSVASDGTVTTTITSDSRSFTYANSEHYITLEAGNYIITANTLEFVAGSSALIRGCNSDNQSLFALSVSSAGLHKAAFSLSKKTTIGIMYKLYSQTCKIMIYDADITDDAYEPYQPSVQEQIVGAYFPMTDSKGLANNTDLNTITEIGNYACYTGSSAATMTNCPTKAGGFRLIVTNLIVSTNKSSTIRYQWIIPNNLDGILCFRRKFDISTNTFNSWYSFGGTVVS